ncbi:ATP-binding protein [Desulfosarcina ovata]|uniref:ATPase n=1 Tax=Desulfosarcina ovata subsp. ovata TaxID=2752305 RepID=A0A5K8ALJ9_9BACT|nr:ATP-binding protein [Desulfosarcina ovata]BBO92474.1 ATPase [Desulfosarcina ovata subsp. ovata]
MKTPDYIQRPLYLDRVMPYARKDIIKILVGQRRVGKSYMLFQLMDRMSEQDPEGQQIYINKELHEFADIRRADDLLEYVAHQRNPDRRLSVFIDELQDIDGFETALRSLQAEGNVDIYGTGSNAKLLSGELATYLSGRYIEIKIYSLTYGEFLTFHGLEKGQESLQSYLKFGGLPYLRHLPLDDTIIFDYLRNVTDAILLKDIVSRYDIRNVSFLQRLARFLADNVGSLVTARKISEYLKSQKLKISHNLVIDYLSYLSNALLVLPARRFDIPGKKIFAIGEKYYFEDLGIRHALVGFRAMDIGKILENIIFMHLKTAGHDVTVGQIGKQEVDFVCEKNGERSYVQAAYVIPDPKVRDREFGNLLAIPDNFPKKVVSMDAVTGGSYQGIEHVHLLDFLLSISK